MNMGNTVWESVWDRYGPVCPHRPPPLFMGFSRQWAIGWMRIFYVFIFIHKFLFLLLIYSLYFILFINYIYDDSSQGTTVK